MELRTFKDYPLILQASSGVFSSLHRESHRIVRGFAHVKSCKMFSDLGLTSRQSQPPLACQFRCRRSRRESAVVQLAAVRHGI